MPALFDKMGIRFQYPDNWTLDESDAAEGLWSVSVQSPGGAFWSVFIHPRGVSPREIVRSVVVTMKNEYPDMDVEPVHESIAGKEIEGSDLNFYCLDLTNTALVRAYQTVLATYLILCQADDREFEQVAPVFNAMTHSLLAG